MAKKQEEEVIVVAEEEVVEEVEVKKSPFETIKLNGHELKGRKIGKVFHSIDGCTYSL